MGDGKHGDSTADVAHGQGRASGDASLERVLGELEDELRVERAQRSPARDKSIPPPLPPRKGPPTPSGTRPHASSLPPPLPSARPSTLPAPPRPSQRPPTQSHAPAPRSVPPPAPRVSGLGRPASIPPRTGVPTAPGIAAPRLEPDSEDVTLVAPREASLGPVDLDALREAALAQAEEWASALAEAKSEARRGRLAYELGRLHEGPLRDLTEAWRYYERAIAATPDHLPSLRGARRVALAKKDHRAALPLFDAEARITADSHRKAALLYAKGRVLEDVLGERDKASELYATAAELDRKDASILKALEQRDLASNDAGELARTLERAANAVAADPRHRAALIVERARLLEHREQRVDAALELYETALRLDPRAGGALEAIERLAAASGRHRELIRALERRAEASADPEERAFALYRVGRLHLERLGNQGEAIAALERAAAEREDDPLVLEELAALYERAERFEPLAQVLTRLAVISRDPAEQLAAWHRIGQLFDERLEAKEDARRAYERALALDPTHVPTLIALGRLYEAAGAWDALTAMHLAEAEEARDPKRRAAAHARVAEVLEREKGQKEEAMAHHARALSLSPGYAPSEKALARLYAEAGKHRELVELHERAVEHASADAASVADVAASGARGDAVGRRSGAAQAIAHLFQIGAIQEDALGEHAQAASTYRRILALDPTSLGALHALQRATERAGRHAELVDALEREATLHGAGPRVAALLTRAGEILDAELGDGDGAIARYRRVLELDPGHAPALSGLGRIFHRMGRWDDLLDLYARELALDPESPALLHKMGQLCEERIGDEARAIEHYRRALEVDPSHRPSLRALAGRLASRREHAELARVLELTLEGLEDPAARARAAYRVGDVYEQHLGAPERAIAAYESALAALPGFLPAADGLARLRAASGAWRRLVDQLEQEAAGTDDTDRAVRKLAQAGELWARALNDPRRAAAVYERAIALSPRHLESLLALERLYGALAHREALARVYGTLARVLGDPGARVAALRELARLEERSGDAELRAIHEAILGLAPDDPGALDALEALALERGDRALLATIDARRIAKAGNAKTAAAYQTRLAESLEAAGDPGALPAYRAALESDPESMAAARGLARVAAKLGMPEAVALAARREAAITPEPRLAARQLVRAAKVAHRELQDPRGALADYERALELWPDDADAAAGLEELLLAGGQAARAADRLARAASSATTAERASALWIEVARLQSELLGNVPAALTSLARVLKSAPTHIPALRRTAELHVRQERYEEAAATLAKVVSIAPDRDVLEAAHLELARLWTERLNDLPRALVSLQAVLALVPDHEVGLRRLAEVAERSGDSEKAAKTLRRLVERASSPAARASALVRLSQVHEAAGDRELAQRAACEALAIEGPSGAAADRHRALITTPSPDRIGWEAHAEALSAWLAAGPREGAGEASLEIARIFREELGRPASAVEVLERAARADHGDLEVRRALASTLRLASRFEEALAELRSLIGEQPVRAELWRELSHTLRASGDATAAQRALLPLVLLGSGHGEELREAGARAPRPAHGRAGSLDASLLEALYPTRRAGALLGLLRHATPALGKLYPPDFDAFGVSPRDRASTRGSDPMRRLSDRISAIFGCGELHLYVHRARGRQIAVELTSPPSILIPASVAELGEPQQAFAIARAAANVAAGLHAVDKLTPRELEMVLAAIARKVVPGFGAGLTGEDVLEDIQRRFYKALPRRSRRDVEEAARAYVGASERDFAAVTEAVIASAQRVALLVSDDLLGAVQVLQRTERDLRELSGPRLVSHPTVSRLVRFWVSPDADALRQRMGLAEAPGSP